jgi:hypothetical protein
MTQWGQSLNKETKGSSYGVWKRTRVRKDANKNSSGSLDKQPGKVHKGMQTVEIKNAFLVEKDSHPIIKQLD